MSAPRFLAGYLYYPQALQNAGRSTSDQFHDLLKDGGLAMVKEAIAAQPELLAELLPIVANPEASINVRLGASVVFESHAGSAALRVLVPRLGELSGHADARVRADACHYLGLSGDARVRGYLAPRLQDADIEVREIAADSLKALVAATSKAAP